MTKIILKALNQNGFSALRQHYRETKKLKFKDRLVFKTAGFTQELISENPYTLCLTMKNRHANNAIYVDLVLGEIKKAMQLNGAAEKDLSIEVDYYG